MSGLLSVGEPVADLVQWMRGPLAPAFDAVYTIVRFLVDGLYHILLLPPPVALAVMAGAAAWLVRGRGFGLFAAAGFLLLDAMGLWRDAMSTLALVLTASLFAVSAGVPLGIWASRSRAVSGVVRPLLDFMQTMPPFVYLIPAVFFFRIGQVPGVVATVVFGMPPAIRLTELGIRQVAPEVVEAGNAFGSTSNQLLMKVQLPLALPTIMAGINQVIMLSLSMVVIAGMIGAGGLGAAVVRSLTQLDIALGFEAGLGVVILAVFLDRLTEGLASARRRRPRPIPASEPRSA
ncbi:ABC transporter permease [Limnochorda pilosa]|uniref:Glycine/betaine ABC transporter permease n=1 Tax=Limnochorda pilosa TaxID=1555112 RepID=A0A0K2SIQ2_LIMPI|nr:proline/glycine betaine ABC transporter permease [Limnochorda pilosa]BAS26970.1 glycine/betaine ABC transporter permease [Limnochorda pilosa]